MICCDEATAALCLLSEDEENCCMLEDEATTADDEDEAFMDDEEAAIDAPCSTVPLSTTVPDSLPTNKVYYVVEKQFSKFLPSIKLNMLALSDLASTTWDDLEADEDLLAEDADTAFKELDA